jgi:uncharacterized protein involved in response to NO
MATISIREAGAAGRRRAYAGPAFLSAGFRPFFLLAALWSAFAIPIWLAAYLRGYAVGGALPAMVWHAHEMVYGYGAAVVAGFLLTAIPNWTGRLPLRGMPLAVLAALWVAGRGAVLSGGVIGAGAAALVDLAFPVALMAAVARELIAGRNWRNLPMLAGLGLLFAGNALVHLQALDIAYTAPLGNRIGIGTLLALIALVGGRIVPSFTLNWLAKMRRDVAPPAQPGRFDRVCLVITLAGIVAWVCAPDALLSSCLELTAGIAAAARLARWRGLAAVREPLLLVLHAGYAWLAVGLACLGLNSLLDLAPHGAPLHALTAGAIGTMTLAVMTRASLGPAGRPLAAGTGTTAIYVLVTLAAVLRVAAPLAERGSLIVTSLAGLAWAGAFGLFALLYGPLLLGKQKT